MPAPPVRSVSRMLVFVYGTLKRGFTNHARYLAVAEAHGGAQLMHRSAATSSPFRLVVRPKHLLPATCGPVMMECDAAEGSQITGEVYQVSPATLEALDILEGVPKGPYYRKLVDVVAADGTSLKCLAYLYPSMPELLALPPKSSYSEEDHVAYCPPSEPNPDIVRLCKVPGHGLATTRPHAMRVHCLRLLPGEDILSALKQFVADRSIGAAAVLSAVGSTGKTTLRPAGSPAPREFDGRFEVVSLSGTLGASRHHLHMSISDAECRTFGGHVMAGCEVRTTLEVVLGEVEGVDFSRPTDQRTGYDELSIGESDVVPSAAGADAVGADAVGADAANAQVGEKRLRA